MGLGAGRQFGLPQQAEWNRVAGAANTAGMNNNAKIMLKLGRWMKGEMGHKRRLQVFADVVYFFTSQNSRSRRLSDQGVS